MNLTWKMLGKKSNLPCNRWGTPRRRAQFRRTVRMRRKCCSGKLLKLRFWNFPIISISTVVKPKFPWILKVQPLTEEEVPGLGIWHELGTDACVVSKKIHYYWLLCTNRDRQITEKLYYHLILIDVETYPISAVVDSFPLLYGVVVSISRFVTGLRRVQPSWEIKDQKIFEARIRKTTKKKLWNDEIESIGACHIWQRKSSDFSTTKDH